MSHIISKRYAKALFLFSKQRNNSNDVASDLTSLLNVLETSAEFNQFLSNPTIPLEKQLSILKILFHDKISTQTEEFLFFLARKKRLYSLKEILTDFLKLYQADRNILEVKVTSRSALDKLQLSAVTQHLKLKLRKEIEPICFVDPEMIGGIKVQIGDEVLDYSIRAQLNRFKESLIHV